MNKQELEKQITKMEAKLAEMKADLNKPEKFKLWKPEAGKSYAAIVSEGYVRTIKYNGYISDIRRIYYHNVFKDVYTAKKRANWLKAYHELCALAEQLNGSDWAPDWKDGDQVKWFLTYDYRHAQVGWTKGYCRLGIVYFKSLETAQLALDTLSDASKEILKKGYY